METTPVVPRRGYLLVSLAALMWAVSGSAGKFLFNQGITPYEVVQSRLLISAVFLFFYLRLRAPKLLRIARGDIGYFLVLGIVGMALVQFAYFFTISKIKVAAAILLQYLAPSLIALHAVICAKEKITPLLVGAIIGALGGCYLVVGGYNLDLLSMNQVGILSGLVSAFSFAWYSIHGERGMRRYSPWTVHFYSLFFAALFWNIAYPPLASLTRSYTPAQWGWIIYIAVFGTLIPFGLYYAGINLIRSTRASITATLEPILAGLFSYLFLGESLSPIQLFGAFLVICSIIVLQLKREYDAATPSLLRSRHRATG